MKEKQEMKWKKRIGKVARIGLVLAGVAVVFLAGLLGGSYLVYRNHWQVSTTEVSYAESGKLLNNPDRGFYSVYGFSISDGNQDFSRDVAEKMHEDEQVLALIQINLKNYCDRQITEGGLEQVDALFRALEKQEKHYIIRFLYDWDGKAEETEPEDIQTILGHMQQLEPFFYEYEDIIFACQGIFVGDYGEMNASPHLTEEGMAMLVEQFLKVTPETMFLSVRTPQQWRTVYGILEQKGTAVESLSRRLGLYNDGMMGTEQDTGTYGTLSKTEGGRYAKWLREEELDFQSQLCGLVPNGGEVIVENPVNDLENAIESLGAMHVTYLNQGYDRAVLEKWAANTITAEGCYAGMDGFSYIERHLGYRLLIAEASLEYEFWRDFLDVEICLQNVGFAPVYNETEVSFFVLNKETKEVREYPVEAEIEKLTGGRETEQVLSVKTTFSLAGLPAGEYEIYFMVRDVRNDVILEFANEQELTKYGYQAGGFTVEPLKNPFNGEEIHPESCLEKLLKKIEE